MKAKTIAASLCITVMVASSVSADVIVYPAKGQSAEQTEKDKYECYQWAKGQTGFDPMAAPTAQTASPSREKEVAGAGQSGLVGGLGGAAVGALLGGSRKSVGRGALIGAGSGALLGGMRRHDQKERESHNRRQWEQRETANYVQNRNDYNRAYSACLSGRGYTVN